VKLNSPIKREKRDHEYILAEISTTKTRKEEGPPPYSSVKCLIEPLRRNLAISGKDTVVLKNEPNIQRRVNSDLQYHLLDIEGN